MRQFIGVIGADQIIDRLISRWVVVMDDELLSITLLEEENSLLRAVWILFPHSYIILEFFRKVMFGCVCVIYRTESF